MNDPYVKFVFNFTYLTKIPLHMALFAPNCTVVNAPVYELGKVDYSFKCIIFFNKKKNKDKNRLLK